MISHCPIGSYTDMHTNMIEDPSDKEDNELLLKRAENYIREVIQLDSQILGFGFPVVGGDIYSVSMDNQGQIKTYINGKEANF